MKTKNDFNFDELNSYYNKSMEVIDNYYVVYRVDNPYARLVVPTKNDSEICESLLHIKFDSHNVKFSSCTLHDYFNILRKMK